MGAHRFYRYCLTALVLIILLASTGNLQAAKASRPDAGVDLSSNQPTYTNFVYLPCIFKPCSPTFFDDFSKTYSGWPAGNLPPSTFQYLDGSYVISIDKTLISDNLTYFSAVVNPNVRGTDYKILASIWINTAPTDGYYYPQYGLVFDSDEMGNKYFTFEVVSDGSWYLWKYEYIDDITSPWSQVAFGTSDKINQGTALNRLGVERNGPSIALYANGTKLYEDAAFPSNGVVNGSIGLIAESSRPYTSISYYFDNFGLFPITCDWADIFNGSFSPTITTLSQALPALKPLSGRIKPGSR